MKGVLAGWMAVAAAVAAALALLQLVRGALAALDGGRDQAAGPPSERSALLAEKRRIINHLRELDFDAQTGKLSNHDLQHLRQRYEREALLLDDRLRTLDAGGDPLAP
ncbi:MAG: hypothetical protein FJ100_05760 [Deltaproteobacteria bacterium]|nr:hypothetical protein [Deltaproteobacteria bacterium]